MKKYSPKDIHYIINARAGKGKPDRLKKMLKKYAQGSEISVTKDEEELTEVFRQESGAKKVFVAVGGDGTVRHLEQYIRGTESVLGVIPTGSGNGLARELGMTGNMAELVDIIEQGNSQGMDVMKINGRTGLNVAGLGFDAELAWHFSRSGIRGLLGYVLAGVRSILHFSPFYVKISYEWTKIEGVYWMVTFANSGQFGNNARIAPDAVPHDGMLDIVLVEPFPPGLFPVFLFRLFTGRLKESRYVKYLKTKGPVTIETSPVRLHIDGDVVEMEDMLDVKLIPGAVKVIVPGNKKDIR